MMWSSHGFFLHLPNFAGFIALIAVWVMFRAVLLRWRRGAMERMRMNQSMPPPMVSRMAAAQGQVRCPRCSTNAPVVASFCPHCGLSLSGLPPLLPQGGSAARPRSGLLLLIWILLGAIGFGAYVFWRWGDESRPAPPPRVRIHEYHR